MMIKITPDPKVLAALQAAFPKPSKSAEKGLKKYCEVLAAMLFNAVQHGQSAYEHKFKLYTLSTYALANKGGQIGPNRQRIHSWLEKNGFALVQVANRGSNLSGQLSQVKLTKWAKMEDTLAINTQAMTEEQAQREIDAFLMGDEASNKALFQHLYPELLEEHEDDYLNGLFDPVQVDTQSLAAYIEWLHTKATKIDQQTKQSIARQARIILGVAMHTKGFYFQRRNPSAFGRTYYTGISVQSVPKELRKAMLGNCWEYDMRSSVIAWKMGYAQDWIAQHCPGASVRDEFKATLLLLEDKQDLMHTVRRYVFFDDSNVDRDLQIGLLKQAFTAVSFGARLTTKGWKDSGGTWQNPALVSILKNADERRRFVNDPTVLAFIKEQNRLDDWLYEQVKLHKPELLRNGNVQTQSGKPSKAKVVAYLYQHNETVVMNLVRDAVKASGRTVLASIHDAVVIDRHLGGELKSEIEMMLHDKTANPYWRLGATKYERYNSTPQVVLEEEKLHRQRMAEQEAKAQGYVSMFAEADARMQCSFA